MQLQPRHSAKGQVAKNSRLSPISVSRMTPLTSRRSTNQQHHQLVLGIELCFRLAHVATIRRNTAWEQNAPPRDAPAASVPMKLRRCQEYLVAHNMTCIVLCLASSMVACFGQVWLLMGVVNIFSDNVFELMRKALSAHAQSDFFGAQCTR